MFGLEMGDEIVSPISRAGGNVSFTIGSSIEADYVNMGILKTVDYTSDAPRRLQLLQYGAAILSGMTLGCFCRARPAGLSAV